MTSDPYEGLCFEARVHDCRGQPDKALDSLARAESCQPRRPEAHLLRAVYCEKGGDRNAAISAYLRASTVAPMCADVYCLRAIMWYRAADFVKSVADCDRAIGIDEGAVMAHIVRGDAQKALSQMGKSTGNEYIEDYSRAMACDARARPYIGRGFSVDRWADFEAFLCEFSQVCRVGAGSLGGPLEGIRLQCDIDEELAAQKAREEAERESERQMHLDNRNGKTNTRDYRMGWHEQGTVKRDAQFKLPKYELPRTKDPARQYSRPWAAPAEGGDGSSQVAHSAHNNSSNGNINNASSKSNDIDPIHTASGSKPAGSAHGGTTAHPHTAAHIHTAAAPPQHGKTGVSRQSKDGPPNAPKRR
eukprot:Opistho-2@13090